MFEERKIWLTIRDWEVGSRGGGISLDDLICQAQKRYPYPNGYTGRSWVERPLRALIANRTAEYRGHLINTLHSGQDLYENNLVFWSQVSEKFGFWKLVALLSIPSGIVTALLPGGVIAQLLGMITTIAHV